jgi:hypothetical protein
MDLFIGLTLPDGKIGFLPDLDGFPVPLQRGLPIGSDSCHKPAVVGFATDRLAPGRYTLCAALVIAGKNPHVASHCAWTERVDLEVTPRS